MYCLGTRGFACMCRGRTHNLLRMTSDETARRRSGPAVGLDSCRLSTRGTVERGTSRYSAGLWVVQPQAFGSPCLPLSARGVVGDVNVDPSPPRVQLVVEV